MGEHWRTLSFRQPMEKTLTRNINDKRSSHFIFSRRACFTRALEKLNLSDCFLPCSELLISSIIKSHLQKPRTIFPQINSINPQKRRPQIFQNFHGEIRGRVTFLGKNQHIILCIFPKLRICSVLYFSRKYSHQNPYRNFLDY